jgi:hypothetical protein
MESPQRIRRPHIDIGGRMKSQNKKRAAVIDLGKHKHKRLVLDAFDSLERQRDREVAEKRAEIQRKARNQY